MKALCWFIFVAGAAVLLFTAQRAGTLGGLISMLPMLLVLSRTQRVRIVVAGAVVSVGLLVWSGASGLSSLEYVAGRYSTQTGLSGRDFLWQMAWNFISRNIFMGHGSGGADLVTQDLFHNSYLEAWYNGGIVGFVAFLAALGRAIYVGFALLRRVDKDIKIEIALSFGFVLGVCFVGFFEGVVAGASTITVILLMVTTTIMERFYYESRQTEEEHEGGDETETLAPDQTLN
jgi:O-antigen ligase